MKKLTRRDFMRATGLGGLAVIGGPALAACGGDNESAPVPGDDPMMDAGVEDAPEMMDPGEDVGGDEEVGEMDAGGDPEGPWWVEGNYGPVDSELESFGLEVVGSIPPALTGLYVRNGSNPAGEAPGHWFFGDGMLHGVRLERGSAAWYRSKWVDTGALRGEGTNGGPPDIRNNQSNTSVVYHADKLLSLIEVGLPHEINPEDLSTLGVYDFEGALRGPMTAHPKLNPATGEMIFFGYGFVPPYLVYHVVDANGRLVRSETIDVPGSTMMHDFQITSQRAVFMDLPIVFDFQEAVAGNFPYIWQPDYGARLGVMPLDGGNSDVQWFDIDPCYIFHTLNAFDDPQDEGKVVLTAARHTSLWADGPESFGGEVALWKYTLDLANGRVSEDRLDDTPLEFPQMDPRLRGRPNRYGYGVVFEAGDPDEVGPGEASKLVKYDLQNEVSTSFDYGSGRSPGEALFVPDGEGEDEGWLMTYVYDKASNTSSLDILDATDLGAGPVASVKLPRRVPYGFHGTWVPDE